MCIRDAHKEVRMQVSNYNPAHHLSDIVLKDPKSATLLQIDRDRIRVDAFCFGDWPLDSDHNDRDAWISQGEAAALAGACLHWTDSVTFPSGSFIKKALLQYALACGRAAQLAPTHTVILAAQRGLFHSLKPADDIKPALRAGAELHKAETAAGFPAMWAPTGCLLWWLTWAAFASQDYSEAIRFAGEARRILSVTHRGTEVLVQVEGIMQRSAQLLGGSCR